MKLSYSTNLSWIFKITHSYLINHRVWQQKIVENVLKINLVI